MKERKKYSFLDWLADQALDSPLFEMALERKIALRKIEAYDMQIANHLMKIFIFNIPNELKNSWLKEIDAWLDILNNTSIKPNSKKFNGSVYYNIIFNNYIENINGFKLLKNNLSKKHPDLPVYNTDDYFTLEKLEKLSHKIAYDIANDEYTTIYDYINLEEIDQ